MGYPGPQWLESWHGLARLRTARFLAASTDGNGNLHDTSNNATSATLPGSSGRPPRGRPKKPRLGAVDIDTKVPSVLGIELARKLEQAIIFGDYEPGSHVVEEEIGLTFRVSRSPVREAFRLLEANGLVVREARRGVRVTPMSPEDLDEVYACRLELEGLCALQAAERCRPEDARDIDRDFADMLTAAETGELRTYYHANTAFIHRIHDTSRNKTLIRLLGGLSRQATRYRYFAYTRFPELMDFSVEANRELVEAVKAHRAERARRITRRLVQNAWTKLQGALGG